MMFENILKSINPFKKIEELNKKIIKLESEKYSARPGLNYIDSLGGMERLRITPIPIRDIVDIAQCSDIIQIIINSLTGEIFRNGIEVKEKFMMKCTNPKCNKEFDVHKKDRVCDECGGELREPDINQKKILEKIIKKANKNDQNLIDVLKETNNDLEVVDDTYILINFEYIYNDKTIIGKEFVEVLRIDPLTIRIIANEEGLKGRNEKNEKVYFCPLHRNEIITESQLKEGKCPKCGGEVFRACYAIGGQTDMGTEPVATEKKFYADHEIARTSKYRPSILYGFSNIFSLYNKVVTLMAMDRDMRTYYTGERTPPGILAVNTSNYENLRKTWNELVEKTTIEPHSIHPLAIETEGKQKNFIEWIDLKRSLQEMQFVEVRNEYRRQICAQYGVTPIFTGEVTTMSNEGLQVVVTNRSIERGQSIYNEKLLPKFTENIGISDYKYELLPNEKRDELSEAQLEAQKIQNAMNMAMLGFKVILNEEKEFEYKDAEPETERTIEPEFPKQTLTENPIQNQRFQGESEHLHPSEAQRFEGESRNIRRGNSITSETQEIYNPNHREKLKKYFENEIQKIAKKEKLSFRVIKKDFDDLINFAEGNLFLKAFEGLTKKESDKIKDIFLESLLSKISYKQIVDKISKITKDKLSEGELERIVRTEMGALKNKSREFSFKQADPEGKRKYIWNGPKDYRTTDTCKRITLRTANGVSLEKLKEIIREESLKDFPDFEPRDFLAHYNCRHTFYPKV